MTFINSVTFDKTAGLPLTGRLAHLSVPLGLILGGRTYYDQNRNCETSDVISEKEFDNLTGIITHKNKTRSLKKPSGSKKVTKKRQPNST